MKPPHLLGVKWRLLPTGHPVKVDRHGPNQTAQLFNTADAFMAAARLDIEKQEPASTGPARLSPQDAIAQRLKVLSVLDAVAALVQLVELPAAFA
jgi:hypothetical protein